MSYKSGALRAGRLNNIASRTGGFKQKSQPHINNNKSSLIKWKTFSKVNEVQKQIAIFDNKNDKLSKEKLELDKEIKKIENKIFELRNGFMIKERNEISKYNKWIKREEAFKPSVIVNDEEGVKSKSNQIRNLRTLENKIEKRLTDLSSAQSSNKQLRLKIDQLRREKNLFKDLRNKLRQDLLDKDESIQVRQENLEKIREEYEKYFKIYKDIEREEIEKQDQYNRGYQTLQVELWKTNVDSKVKTLKDQRRTYWKAKDLKKLNKSRLKVAYPEKFKEDKEDQENNTEEQGYMTKFDSKIEKERQRRIRIQTEIQNDENNRKLEDKLEVMQSIIDKMIQKTKKEDLDKLEGLRDEDDFMSAKEWDKVIKIYQKKAEINQKKNEEARALLEELESLKRTRDEINYEIRRQRELRKKPWRKRDDAISEYDKELKKVREKIDYYRNGKKEMKEIINSVNIGIPIILERIGCEDFIKKSSSEETAKIDEEVIKRNLETLEKRTNQILILFENFQHREGVKYIDETKLLNQAQKVENAQELFHKMDRPSILPTSGVTFNNNGVKEEYKANLERFRMDVKKKVMKNISETKKN